MSPAILKVVATVVAAVAFAVVAFVLAFSGAPEGTVIVDGGAALAVPGGTAAAGSSAVPGVGVESGGGAGPGAEIVVEIVGAVPRPGVFRLAPGSRVGDLVGAAGGYGPRVDTARAELELNLAATLHDGDQVRVPSRDDAPAVEPAGTSATPGGPATPGGAPLDINRATQAELEALPGIGPATALKIIAAREEAPFAAVEELRTRGVLGEKTFEKLRELVAVR
ncbi:MAG: ComEA family DNA-binding protein [Chloroflexota bacterium]|jgi:competence protein ComEA|nr:ComEA family DNA-binding protein [Chloroflexota bacterium]